MNTIFRPSIKPLVVIAAASLVICTHASAQILTASSTVEGSTNINLNSSSVLDYTYYFYPGEVVQPAVTNFTTTLTGPGTGGYNSYRATATNSVTYTNGYVTNNVTGNTNPTNHQNLGSGDSDVTNGTSLTYSPHGNALSSYVTLTSVNETFNIYLRNYADGSSVSFTLSNSAGTPITTLNNLTDIFDGSAGGGSSVEGFVTVNVIAVAGDVLTFTDTPVNYTGNQYSSTGMLLATQVVPEPSAYALLGMGMMALLGLRRFRGLQRRA